MDVKGSNCSFVFGVNPLIASVCSGAAAFGVVSCIADFIGLVGVASEIKELLRLETEDVSDSASGNSS